MFLSLLLKNMNKSCGHANKWLVVGSQNEASAIQILV